MTLILTGLLGGAVVIGSIFGLVLWSLNSCRDEDAEIRKEIEKWRDGK